MNQMWRDNSSEPIREHFMSEKEYLEAMDSYKHLLEREREHARDKKEDELFTFSVKRDKEKSEYESKNRFFISLATLSAASITLLIQHVLSSFFEYQNYAQYLLKITLVLFGVTLILSILHNYFNVDFEKKKHDRLLIEILSLISVCSYTIGVCTLIFAVLINL